MQVIADTLKLSPECAISMVCMGSLSQSAVWKNPALGQASVVSAMSATEVRLARHGSVRLSPHARGTQETLRSQWIVGPCQSGQVSVNIVASRWRLKASNLPLRPRTRGSVTCVLTIFRPGRKIIVECSSYCFPGSTKATHVLA